MKSLIFLLGLAGGASGATSWLLSESEVPGVSLPYNERLELLKTRLTVALDEGKRAGEDAENRVRNSLNTYRLHPDRPGTSA
jgi:hypothetical protein